MNVNVKPWLSLIVTLGVNLENYTNVFFLMLGGTCLVHFINQTWTAAFWVYSIFRYIIIIVPQKSPRLLH